MDVKSKVFAILAFIYLITDIKSQGTTPPATTPASGTSTSGTQASTTTPGTNPASSGNTTMTKNQCHVSLLRLLTLDGLDKDSKPAPMGSCGLTAGDNCCSEIDEIKIIKSWNTYSLPKIRKYAKDVEDVFDRISKIVPAVLNININRIKYHEEVTSWRRSNATECYINRFYEFQQNVDLLIGPKLIGNTVIKETALSIIQNLTALDTGIVNTAALRRVFRTIFTRPFRREYINALGFPSMQLVAVKNIASAVIAQLTIQSKIPGSGVDFSAIVTSQTPATFLESGLQLTKVITSVTNDISAKFFTAVLQAKAVRLHVLGIIGYMKSTLQLPLTTLAASLNDNSFDQVSLISDISNALWNDQPLKRYLAWFLVPGDEAQSLQVKQYLSNRIFKLITDSFERSSGVSLTTPSLYLKNALATITATIDTLLTNNYCQVAAAGASNLLLETLVGMITIPTGRASTPYTLFQNISNALYTSSFVPSVCPVAAQIDPAAVQTNIMARLTDVLTSLSNTLGFSVALPAGIMTQIPAAVTQFTQLNRDITGLAEFTFNNNRICANVTRSNLVKQAVFNPAKFRFCQRAFTNLQVQNLTAILGQMPAIIRQMGEILDLKKGLYCAACSRNLSQFISPKGSTVDISNQFCINLVQKYKDYFIWRSTVLTNFTNSMYQYLQCHASGANPDDSYPYIDKDNTNPQPLPGLNECLNVTDPTKIAPCNRFCSSFSIANYSSIIDGDRLGILNIFNFALDVLRKNGMRYGVYRPRNASSATGSSSGSSSRSRILSELDNWVEQVESSRVFERQLQATTTQSTSSSTATTGTTANTGTTVTNGKPPSSGTGNATTAPAPRTFTGRNTIAKYLYLAQTIDTLKTFVSVEHYNHDELTNMAITYFAVEKVNAAGSYLSKLKPMGIDLFELANKINFSMTRLDSLAVVNSGEETETLNKIAIADVVQISKKNIGDFNGDVNLVISPKLPIVPKFKGEIKPDRPMDFAGFRGIKASNKRKRVRKLMTREELRKRSRRENRKLQTSHNHHHNKKEEHATTSISDFLFKLLF